MSNQAECWNRRTTTLLDSWEHLYPGLPRTLCFLTKTGHPLPPTPERAPEMAQRRPDLAWGMSSSFRDLRDDLPDSGAGKSSGRNHGGIDSQNNDRRKPSSPFPIWILARPRRLRGHCVKPADIIVLTSNKSSDLTPWCAQSRTPHTGLGPFYRYPERSEGVVTAERTLMVRTWQSDVDLQTLHYPSRRAVDDLGRYLPAYFLELSPLRRISPKNSNGTNERWKWASATVRRTAECARRTWPQKNYLQSVKVCNDEESPARTSERGLQGLLGLRRRPLFDP